MSLLRYPKYKDSGVVWLGDVPAHWQVIRLRWLFEIKKRISGELGYDVLSITQNGIKIKDIESNDGQLSMDYSKYQIVEIGDFAMNHMDLLTGYVDIASQVGVTSPDYRVFSTRNHRDCYDKFALYLFQMGYRNKIFYAYGQGSSQFGRWRLPTEQFNDLTFPIPAIQEQQAIADFLDRETAKIDALVAEQETLIALLKEKRQAMISHVVTKGLNPNAPMKDSGIEWLGEVPAHWDIKRLKHVCNVFPSNVDKKSYDDESPVLLCNYTDVYYNEKITADLEFMVATATEEQIAKFSLKAGDVIITKDSETANDIAIPAFVPNDLPNVICGYHLSMVRVQGYNVGLYIKGLFDSSFLKAQFETLANGLTRVGLSQYAIDNVAIPLPPAQEQTAIATFLDSETDKLDALTAEANRAITLLKERRSALISAAVTGKINVTAPIMEPA
jgi:type I restriction enzyme, S subunit